jgi:hypothetical protein
MNWGMIAQGSRSGSAQRPAPALAAKSAASMKIVPSAVCLGRPWRNLISREAVLFVQNFSAAREKRTSGGRWEGEPASPGRSFPLRPDGSSSTAEGFLLYLGRQTDRSEAFPSGFDRAFFRLALAHRCCGVPAADGDAKTGIKGRTSLPSVLRSCFQFLFRTQPILLWGTFRPATLRPILLCQAGNLLPRRCNGRLLLGCWFAPLGSPVWGF